MNFEKREYLNGRITLYRDDGLELQAAGLLTCDAIISDPPYGVEYQHGGRDRPLSPGTKTYTGKIIGDDRHFDPSPWVNHAGDKPIVLFGADHYKTRLPEGGRFICWDKSCGQGAASSFVDAEFAWTNRRNPRAIYRHFWMGATRAGRHANEKRQHVSQKPVELMAWCMEHARIGVNKVVLDPYMGSGLTGIACLMTGRRFVGVEIDPGHRRVRVGHAWVVRHHGLSARRECDLCRDAGAGGQPERGEVRAGSRPKRMNYRAGPR